jgi:hypothetical protein
MTRAKQCSVAFTTAVALFALVAAPSNAALVGREDFDGGAVNLISSSVTNLDGGSGDWFGVANIGAWPQQPAGPPFSLVDDSVANVSGGGVFPGDTEGLVGQNRDPDDDFFALSDTREWSPAQRTASWTFDIAGFSDLKLSVDLGAQANSASNGFGTATSIIFSYSIDGGPTSTAFSIAPEPNFGTFAYRPMDSTTVPPVGANGPLEASGDNPVNKTLADTGAVSADTFLNKTPAAGAGAGLMDSFATALNGAGSQLTLLMTADVPFEAAGFDNITITGVPEPTSMLLWVLASIAMGATCRSRSPRPNGR